MKFFAVKIQDILISFVHPNHASETLSFSEQIKSFVDVFEIYLMCDKLIQLQFLKKSTCMKNPSELLMIQYSKTLNQLIKCCLNAYQPNHEKGKCEFDNGLLYGSHL